MLRQKISSYINLHPNECAFLIIFTTLLFLNLTGTDFNWYYDSDAYWSLSNNFVKNNQFSLLNYDKGLRGYLFPLILHFVSKLARLLNISNRPFYEIFNSFVYSLFLTAIIPSLVQRIYNKKIGLIPIIVFSITSIFFLRGLFFYPLSDIASFFLLVLGIFVTYKSKKNWWIVVFAGLCWGGASLVRPSYQITLIPLLFWAIYYYRVEVKLHNRSTLLRIIMILAGLLLIFTPQLMINIDHFGVASPFVQTQVEMGENLYLFQLTGGIQIQKYETNIGSTYPTAGVRYLDQYGEKLLIKSGYKSVSTSISGAIGPDKPLKLVEYILLVFKFPFDFAFIYLRHFFNGLDIVYSSPYISDFYQFNYPLRLINYSLWFLITYYFVTTFRVQKLLVNSKFLLPAILATPALLAIPTIIEVRFMLPLHLMSYIIVSFLILPEYINRIYEQKIRVKLKFIPWYIVFVLVCFVFSYSTYLNIQHKPNSVGSQGIQKPKAVQYLQNVIRVD